MEVEESFEADGRTLAIEVEAEGNGFTSQQTQSVSIPAGAEVTVRISDTE